MYVYIYICIYMDESRMMPAPHKWRSRAQVNTASNACLQICIYTAYCIWRVISPISELNRLFSSLRLFYHVPLKRDQMDWDRRTRLDDTPNVIGCIYKWVTTCPFVYVTWLMCMRHDSFDETWLIPESWLLHSWLAVFVRDSFIYTAYYIRSVV